MINTFEEKLAYEIGIKLAHQDYLEKEANMAAFKALGSGLKGVVTGQGTNLASSFQAGVRGAQGAYKGPTNFRAVTSEIGKGLAKPWQQMYQTFGARQGVKRYTAAQKAQTDAAQNLSKLRSSGGTAEQIQAAQNQLREAGRNFVNVRKGYGNQSLKELKAQSMRRYGDIARDNLGTMATGVGIAGAGTYMAGNAAFGGGNTYVTNKVQPQKAPHEYYLNKFFGS